MSLSSLVSSHDSSAPLKRGLPTWLLPVGLLLGFTLVFVLLFGERLLPSVAVQTTAVVTLRGEVSDSAATNSQELLFQASGWIEPDPYAIQVPALVNGIVADVHVLAGEDVKKEDLLATLVDDEARLTLERAERNLTTIRSRIVAHCSQVPERKARLASTHSKITAQKARLAEVQDTANRLKALPQGAASLEEITAAILQVERQQALLAEAESEVPRIEAELDTIDYERLAMGNNFLEAESDRDLAQLALDRHRITSPIDGRVLHLHAQPGKKRLLNMDDPKSNVIVELYQPTQMQARIDVPLNEAAALGVGQRVELITDLLPDLELAGTVTRITGEADLARNTIQAKVAISNPDDRLRPEMLVRAKFYSPEQPPNSEPTTELRQERLVIYAPESALFEVNDETAKAWVVGANQLAEQRSLILGRTRKEGALEVREGLRTGEQLILPPFLNLKPGARLSVSSSNF